MRLLPLLTAALLPVNSLATNSKAPDDRFTVNSAEAQPLELDGTSYEKLTKAPRDYSVAVLLTAMETRFGCELCHQFESEWELLAKTWTTGDKNKLRLLFGTLDFTDGKRIFQSLMLQTAPFLIYFPPTTGPHAKTERPYEKLDLNTGINKAEQVHDWLSRQMPDQPHPRFVRPVNYVKIATTVASVLGSIAIISIAVPYVWPIIQNRNLWAAVSLIAVLLFTSGHMFNHIRKVPYVSHNGQGKAVYISGGFQNQLRVETQIVAAIYGILSFATISLALKTPRIVDPRKQQMAVIVCGGVMLAAYSFLISIFRMKNGGYPFWLPPF